MDGDKNMNLRGQAQAARHVLSGWNPEQDQRRFLLQYRLYMGLLIFIVAAGLPIVSLPVLRSRLSTRLHILREAVGPLPLKSVPAWAKVGENRYPFPKELERPVVPQPQYSRLLDMRHMVYGTNREGTSPKGLPAGGSEPISSSPAEAGATGAEAPPEFRQGKIEQEAYDILLKSNATVAGMVKGGDASLRFKTWSAAKTEADTYLVDLTFVQAPDNAEGHYIWKVNLATKQITPESRLARTLSKS